MKPDKQRPISLLKVWRKLSSGLLLGKVKKLTDSNISELQFGFRENHSTEQPVSFLLGEIELSMASKSPLVIISLDIKKAFDSVTRPWIHTCGLAVGCNPEILDWLISMDALGTCHISLKQGLKSGSSFPTLTGVPQGSVEGPSFWL